MPFKKNPNHHLKVYKIKENFKLAFICPSSRPRARSHVWPLPTHPLYVQSSNRSSSVNGMVLSTKQPANLLVAADSVWRFFSSLINNVLPFLFLKPFFLFIIFLRFSKNTSGVTADSLWQNLIIDDLTFWVILFLHWAKFSIINDRMRLSTESTKS